MRKLFAKDSIAVAKGQVISGVASRDQVLRVVCGQVWVTIEGQLHDHWLSAGQTLRLTPNKLVVIEADTLDSRVAVPASKASVKNILSGLLAGLRPPAPRTCMAGVPRSVR